MQTKMVIKKQEKGKKSPSKEKQQTTIAPTPEEISITLALAQALGSPHDEESFRLTIQRKEFDPWSYKLQSMRTTPSKQYYI